MNTWKIDNSSPSHHVADLEHLPWTVLALGLINSSTLSKCLNGSGLDTVLSKKETSEEDGDHSWVTPSQPEASCRQVDISSVAPVNAIITSPWTYSLPASRIQHLCCSLLHTNTCTCGADRWCFIRSQHVRHGGARSRRYLTLKRCGTQACMISIISSNILLGFWSLLISCDTCLIVFIGVIERLFQM